LVGALSLPNGVPGLEVYRLEVFSHTPIKKPVTAPGTPQVWLHAPTGSVRAPEDFYPCIGVLKRGEV